MKIFITLFVLFILLLSLSLGVDFYAQEIQDEALHRAVISFGLAKGLNAVISLLQGTELSFTPIGVGLNFSVGEILDPFNDMVERFSWVMLIASVSLGVQKILLTLSSTLFMQVALVLSVSMTLFFVWVKAISSNAIASVLTKFFALLVILRFSAIVFIYFTVFIHNSVLQGEYEEASQVIEQTKIELDELNNKNRLVAKQQKKEGFFSGLSSKYDQVLENLNISKQLDSMQTSLENASNKIITLITIFVVETILLPLLYFWLLVSTIKYIFRLEFDKDILILLYNKQN